MFRKICVCRKFFCLARETDYQPLIFFLKLATITYQAEKKIQIYFRNIENTKLQNATLETGLGYLHLHIFVFHHSVNKCTDNLLELERNMARLPLIHFIFGSFTNIFLYLNLKGKNAENKTEKMKRTLLDLF